MPTVPPLFVAIASGIYALTSPIHTHTPSTPEILPSGATLLPIFPTCTLPEMPSPQNIRAVGVVEASTLSSASLTGQGMGTYYSNIKIEGDTPLTLLLSSHAPRIWDIEGPVAQVVAYADPHNFPVGIIGVPVENISFIDSRCSTAFQPGRRQWRERIGIADDYIISDGGRNMRRLTMQDIDIPRFTTGEIEYISHFVLSDTDVNYYQSYPIRDHRRITPIEVDISQLVTTASAEEYIIYPTIVGMYMLQDKDLIRDIDRTDFTPWMRGYLQREDVDITAFLEVPPYLNLTFGIRPPVVDRQIHGFYEILQETNLPQDTRLAWLVPEGIVPPTDVTEDQCIFLMENFEFKGPDFCPITLGYF